MRHQERKKRGDKRGVISFVPIFGTGNSYKPNKMAAHLQWLRVAGHEKGASGRESSERLATGGEACPAEWSRATQSMGMFYVYIIRSESYPDQTYTGFTEDLKGRFLKHNQGGRPHMAKFIPWRIEFYCAFKHENKARQPELYLKSHSGKAFASKRLL